jgi:hypothetical protein
LVSHYFLLAGAFLLGLHRCVTSPSICSGTGATEPTRCGSGSDTGVWERTRKPWIILVDVAARRFPVSRRMPTFSPILDQCVADWHAHPNRPSQSDATYGASALRGLAYFSMEFGLGDALPLCAGGLGVLAGDLMKITSDLGVYVAPVDGTARCQPAHLESLYPRWPEHDGRDRPHHQRAARA